MELVLIALLVVVVIAFIAYPLLAPPQEERAPAPAGKLDGLFAQRDAMYDALRDLDFDFQLGKLSPSDYQTLREQYKARAALVLQQIDAAGVGNGKHHPAEDHSGPDGVSAQIEAQVASLRRSKPAPADAIEQEVKQLRRRGARSGSRCSKCGTPYQTGDRFCAKCGTQLT